MALHSSGNAFARELHSYYTGVDAVHEVQHVKDCNLHIPLIDNLGL